MTARTIRLALLGLLAVLALAACSDGSSDDEGGAEARKSLDRPEARGRGSPGSRSVRSCARAATGPRTWGEGRLNAACD